MQDRKIDLTSPLRRLPDVALPSFSGGPPIAIRAPRRHASILLLLHGGGCKECRRYAEDVAERESEIREWDGHPIAIIEDSGRDSVEEDDGGLPFPLMLDRDGVLGKKLGVEVPAVIIADQWGEIYAAEQAGAEHQFLAPEELIEWSKYLAIQCPECQGEAL